MNALDLLERIHGHVGVLAAAALFHPAILLRRGRPMTFGVRLAVGLSCALTVLAFSLGLYLYEDYRQLIRRDLFVTSVEVGLLFETKEHLAYAVMALVTGATACAFVAPRDAPRLRQLGAALFFSAAALCLVVTGLGLVVASTRGF